MPNLFPVFSTPPPLEAVQQKQRENLFKPSVYFDFERGDFTKDGLNRVRESSGYEAWKQWCIKAIYTERYAHSAYSSNIGVELEKAFAAHDRDTAAAIIQQTITDAIMFDPIRRTQAVGDFTFNWQEDHVQVSCTITSVNGDKADIAVALTRGGV